MTGFTRDKLQLGDKQPVHQYKLCAKCEEQKPPEGGIDMSPTRWYCSTCWVARTLRNQGDSAHAKTKAARAA